jgi:hypothetical protein
MKQMVIAKLTYKNPKTGELYTVNRGWPCKDEQDAQLTVKYYGMKTGALSADCVMEELNNEEIKPSKTSITTAQTHQA